MKIYIVRHGQVDHNLHKQYNNKDEDLNATGIKEAEEIRDVISNISYDVIISSPLLRAAHTANIINTNNKDLILDERLKERDPASLSGRSIYVTDREEYWNYYSKIQYGTSENIVKFFNRVHDFLNELKQKKYDIVLIVAHSGVSKAFYGYFNGIPEDGKFLNLGLQNCEIKEYEI